MKTTPDFGKRSISIIVPVFEPLHLVDRCLDSLLSYTDRAGLELVKEIVIVDNSAEAWPTIAPYNALLTERGIQLVYCKTDKNLLHVESINLGLKYSTGTGILFFNDDIEIPKTQGRWLVRMIQCFTDVKKCGIATLTLLHRDHSIYWVGNGPKSNEHYNYKAPFDFIPREYYLESPWSNLACALVRRSLFEIVPFDGVDPITGDVHTHYVADHFFGRRAHDEGFVNVVCRDTWIYHLNERVLTKMVPAPQRFEQVMKEKNTPKPEQSVVKNESPHAPRKKVKNVQYYFRNHTNRR